MIYNFPIQQFGQELQQHLKQYTRIFNFADEATQRGSTRKSDFNSQKQLLWFLKTMFPTPVFLREESSPRTEVWSAVCTSHQHLLVGKKTVFNPKNMCKKYLQRTRCRPARPCGWGPTLGWCWSSLSPFPICWRADRGTGSQPVTSKEN